MIKKLIIIGSLTFAMAGSALSQSSPTPPATTPTLPGNTIQVVTYRSVLSTLNLNEQTAGRRGSGDAVTTMRLERNASGKLIRATVMVKIESETAQPETFSQIQLGNGAGALLTIPVTGALATVPGEDSRTIQQAEIVDAPSLAQIETFLRNPAAFSLTVGTAATPSGVLSGSFEVDQDISVSRTDARLKTLGSLDRAIYRLVVLMAYKDGTISQAERDTMMAQLAVFTKELNDAGSIGSGMAIPVTNGTSTGAPGANGATP